MMPTFHSRRQQHGLSLVELMVAITLGAFILLAITQIYSANLRSNDLQSGFARVQESGRYAMEIMARAVRNADYWGCPTNNTANIQNNLDTGHANYGSQAQAVVSSLQQAGLAGVDNVGVLVIDGRIVAPGTDVITLAGAGGTGSIQVEEPYMNTSSAALHISTGNGLKKGDILLLTDCQGGDIFEVTSANPNTSGTVTHNTGTVTVVGNATKNFSKSYGADASIVVPRSLQFFVAPSALDTDGDGQPRSLYRAINGSAEELVLGVEDLQITYGEDTNSDQVVDAYRTAGAVGDMNNVLSVRMNVVVASEADNINPDAIDGRLRRSYSLVANIRNRMGG